MSNLPHYSGDNDGGPDCVKCGFDEAGTTYVPQANGLLGMNRLPDGSTTYDEYLLRECKRCGYPWAERCLDY